MSDVKEPGPQGGLEVIQASVRALSASRMLQIQRLDQIDQVTGDMAVAARSALRQRVTALTSAAAADEALRSQQYESCIVMLADVKKEFDKYGRVSVKVPQGFTLAAGGASGWAR